MAASNRGRKRLLYWVGLVTLLIIILGAFSDWIVEWLWLDSLNYSQVFWTIKGTQFLLFFGALVVSLLYILPNMYYLTKRVPYIDLSLTRTPFGNINLTQFNTGQIRTFLYIIGTFLSLFFSFAFFMQWDTYFRFHWSEIFGRVDPIFGHDIGFYIFRLPFIEMIQNSLIVLVFFVTILIAIFYLVTGSISFESGESSKVQTPTGVGRHISVNIGIWLLLLAWSYYLERYQLLYDSSGVVYGAGYTEINILLPVFWIMTVGCILLACIAFFQTYRSRIGWLLKGGLAVLAIAIVGQVLLPPAIQNFSVEPNELELETPYLKHNIEQTRYAYNLNTFNQRNYDAGATLTFDKIEDNTATLSNIRLWDPRLIIQTYRQLQEIRLYYQFFSVDLDRYQTNEGYKQMMISARELSADLPEQAQTWVNQHLQYTHGYGLVMSPVAEIGPQGDPRLVIKDLPPVSEDIGLETDRAAIYYGETSPEFKLVDTEIEELDYPKGDANVYTHYAGNGGVSIDNIFEKLLFAWEFGDFNLLLTDYLRDGSKIQFWKSIQERVRKIAPFLRLEDDPYLVLSEGKLYWIQDAYTHSPHYPYSEPYRNQYNYLRNSIKVVVDAYHGSVDFYVADEDDPVLNVYRDIFPDMFKPLDEMPATLKSHVRYPKRLFEVQMDIYNTYHMTNPQVFYNNEDLWTRPNEKYGGRQIKMEPYYILSKLPGEDELQYLLISPLTPNNRDNMIAWMAAKSDFPEYGQVEVFNLPKERLFLGPAQIEAKIDQDTEISRQLALWDQRGSRVIRGNLMIIPIEDSFIYVEPVFLIAEGVDIPQLQRVIATTGEQVVMEPTLDLAIEALFGKRPKEPIMREEPPATIPQDTVQVQQPSPEVQQKLDQFRTLWNELQQALQDSEWETFGQKMQEIEELIDDQ